LQVGEHSLLLAPDAHNARVGGATHSKHLTGEAADFSVRLRQVELTFTGPKMDATWLMTVRNLLSRQDGEAPQRTAPPVMLERLAGMSLPPRLASWMPACVRCGRGCASSIIGATMRSTAVSVGGLILSGRAVSAADPSVTRRADTCR
jgi:hypothetical protein